MSRTTLTLSDHHKTFIKRVALTLAEQGVTEPTEEQMLDGMRQVLGRDQALYAAFYGRTHGNNLPREFAGIIYKRLRERRN